MEVLLAWIGLPPGPSLPDLGLTRPRHEKTMTEDSLLFWRLLPDAECDVHCEGLRGYVLGEGPSLDRYRIACVGDSCTFGMGVPLESTYAMVMERSLRERIGGPLETVIAAIPGYSSHQSRLLFESRIAGLTPNITVIYCGAWNDFIPATLEPDEALTAWNGDVISSGIRGLRTLRLIRSAFLPRPIDRDDVRGLLRSAEYPRGPRVSLEAFQRNLKALIDRARAEGGEVILIKPPLPRKTRDEIPIADRYGGCVVEVGRNNGVPVIDGNALFDDHYQSLPEAYRARISASELYFSDMVHPTSLGHRLLAERILDSLDSMGLIRPIAGDQEVGDAHQAKQNEKAIELQEGHHLTSIETDTVEGTYVLTVKHLPHDGSEPVLFLGPYLISTFSSIAEPGNAPSDSRRFRFRLPPIPPGRQKVCVFIGGENVPGTLFLDVPPPALRVRWLQDERISALEMIVEGPPHSSVLVYVSSGLRKTPLKTRAGDFALRLKVDWFPEDRKELEYPFDRLPGRIVVGSLDSSGQGRFKYEVPATMKAIDDVYLQCLVRAPAPYHRRLLSKPISLPPIPD